MLRIFLFTAAALLLLASCSKNGEVIVQQPYTTLGVRALTIDALLLKVEVDDSALTAPMISPFYTSLGKINYVGQEHRIRMTDLYSNRLMLDTVVKYNKGTQTTLSFVQAGAGGKIVWVGPPVSEPAPPAGRTKISLVYVTNDLPGEVKIVVDNSRSGSSELDYFPTDSFLLKKGQFSPYFMGWAGSLGKKPRFTIYTPDAARTLIATIPGGAFSGATAGISIFSFVITAVPSNALTKLY